MIKKYQKTQNCPNEIGLYTCPIDVHSSANYFNQFKIIQNYFNPQDPSSDEHSNSLLASKSSSANYICHNWPTTLIFVPTNIYLYSTHVTSMALHNNLPLSQTTMQTYSETHKYPLLRGVLSRHHRSFLSLGCPLAPWYKISKLQLQISNLLTTTRYNLFRKQSMSQIDISSAIPSSLSLLCQRQHYQTICLTGHRNSTRNSLVFNDRLHAMIQ